MKLKEIFSDAGHQQVNRFTLEIQDQEIGHLFADYKQGQMLTSLEWVTNGAGFVTILLLVTSLISVNPISVGSLLSSLMLLIACAITHLCKGRCS